MTVSITFYVERDWAWKEIELEIEVGSYSRARPGRTNCLPENAIPNEPEETEIGTITCNGKPWVDPDGNPCELTSKEEERAIEELAEKSREDLESRYDEETDRERDY